MEKKKIEIFKPQILARVPRRRFKLTDIFVFVVLLVVIVALAITLFGKLNLKHEVSSARAVSDRVISDIGKQNARGASALGDSQFQARHSEMQLKQLFTSTAQIAKGNPSVDRQIVSNGKNLQMVNIIYKYSSKPPYFIRITVDKTSTSHKWELVGISGNSSEAALIVK